MSITKFMVAVGPVHEKDLADVCKRLDHYPDVRVSTYESMKPKRVIRTTGKRTHKTVTPEGIAAMQKLRDNGNNNTRIAELTGYSKSTVARYTHEPLKENLA